MKALEKKRFLAERRARRTRRNVFGTPERPRLSVNRTLKHMHLQVIDDVAGRTLVAASTVEKVLREKLPNGGNRKAALAIGDLIAKRALEKGIKQVVFDRGGNPYHGRVKDVAEAARKAGLKF